MRFIFLFFIGFVFNGFSQEEEILVDPEIPASFPGGDGKMMTFIHTHLIIPSDLEQSGKVWLRFDILKNGKIKTIQVIRGIDKCDGCNQIAISIVKKMPKWIPAQLNGKTIKSHYSLPIVFKKVQN